MTRNRSFAPLALAFALLAPGLLPGEVVPASRQFEIAPPQPGHGLTSYYVDAKAIALGSKGFLTAWWRYFPGYTVDVQPIWSEAARGYRFLAYREGGWTGGLNLAPLGGDRFVTVWCHSPAAFSGNLRFRRFEAGSRPVDPAPVEVSEALERRDDCKVRVASNGDGLFVVAWKRITLVGPGNLTRQVLARVFGPDGRPVSPEIAVTAPGPGTDTAIPAVGMDAAGNFVVLWPDVDTDLQPIHGQRFDVNGLPLGEPFRIGSRGQHYYQVLMSMAPSGEFVAAWSAPRQDRTLLLGRFAADGRRLGDPVRQAQKGLWPEMAADRSGRVALFWSEGRRMALQVFDSSLVPLGPTLFDSPVSASPVTPYTAGGVAFAEDGRILTVWLGPHGRNTPASILGRFWRVH